MPTTPSPTPPASVDRADATAGRRILRQFSVFIGVGYLAYGLLTAQTIAASFDVMDPWWSAIMLPLVFGTGIALAPLSFGASVARLRTAAMVAAGAYTLAVATWWFAWNGEHIDLLTGIWFSQIVGLPAIAVALGARRPVTAFVWLALTSAATVAINQTIRTEDTGTGFLADYAWSLTYATVFLAATSMGLRTVVVLSATRAQAYAAAAHAAAVRSRTTERRRFDQLTHDGVMSTLLAAARQGVSPQLAEQARATLADIDSLREPSDTSAGPVAGDFAVARIRAACALVDPGLSMSTTIGPDAADARDFPPEMVRTVASATAEALRNAERHAGDGATVTVAVAVDRHALSVEVVDDGVGFDPDAVGADRLGISVSIRSRMAQLPGARAEVHSQRGRGTTVRLRWSARDGAGVDS